ncbi:hypothetical protein [Aeromonas hydrophila]|uniref:hypothetical protein n=1 Tax=Aeromonas hydrophila TaxID=644 RepID=UPI003D1C096C
MPVIVTDEFDLKNEGRIGGNGRRYVLHSVRAMIQSKATQQGLQLRELYGYFGHGRRELADKLKLAEVEVVNVNGKPVVIENVPSNITIALDMDDSGLVSHTEEILDTPPGLIVQSMRASNVGGWSWATGGMDSAHRGGPAYARTYYGCDYVNQPNFVPPDRQAAMLESVSSASDQIITTLEGRGFDADSLQPMLESWGRLSEAAREACNHQLDFMMMEGMLMESKGENAELRRDLDAAKADWQKATEHRQQMLLEALDSVPMMITKSQRKALLEMNTPEDAQVFRSLLESLSGTDIGSLPLGGNKQTTVSPSAAPARQPSRYAVNFTHSKNPFQKK